MHLNETNHEGKSPASAAEVYAAIADEHSIAILKMAYEGFKVRPYSYDKLNERSFRVRLNKLLAAGLIEKTGTRYIVTSLGAIIVNEQLKFMDHLVAHFWHLKAIDVLKSKKEVPHAEKQRIISRIMADCKLSNVFAESDMTGFALIRDFRDLAAEVTKLCGMAEKEVYLASRYHDPNFSRLMFKKVSEGVKLHLLDSTPAHSSVAKRLDAILRTPPDAQTAKSVADILVSGNFDLRQGDIEASFMVVDGRTVCFEIANFANPEEFTLAMTHYNDEDLARQLIDHFNIIAKNAQVPEIVVKARAK